jgi:hypothetical protein
MAMDMLKPAECRLCIISTFSRSPRDVRLGVIRVDSAASVPCRLSGQFRKCQFGVEGIWIGVIHAPKLEARIIAIKPFLPE